MRPPKKKPVKSPKASPIKSVVKNSNECMCSINSNNNDPYNGKRRKQTKIKKFFKKPIKKIENQGSAIKKPNPQNRRENYHKKYGNQNYPNYSKPKPKLFSPNNIKKNFTINLASYIRRIRNNNRS
tara:strand:+ start:453 stop:830 length:378 start_codon:yes stop_codon:yes gene_type:complete